MNLRPPEVIQKFESHPIGGGSFATAEVIVKYFNPYGTGTWLITEAEKQEDGDWLLFGLCHIFEWEWGYVLLSELEEVSLRGMPGIIEIDQHFPEGMKVRDLKL